MSKKTMALLALGVGIAAGGGAAAYFTLASGPAEVLRPELPLKAEFLGLSLPLYRDGRVASQLILAVTLEAKDQDSRYLIEGSDPRLRHAWLAEMLTLGRRAGGEKPDLAALAPILQQATDRILGEGAAKVSAVETIGERDLN